MKKIVIISNTLSSLFIFRSELINKLSELNYKIYLLSNKDVFDDELNKKILKKNNINYKFYYLNRTSTNIFKEIFSFINIFFLLYKIKPSLVLSFTIKPVIYCGLINYIFKFKHLSTITGLGRVFYPIWRTNNLRKTVILLYKVSQNNTKKIFFQNEDDKEYFINQNIIPLEKTIIVNGSGVDIDKFPFDNFGYKKNNILMIARLLNQKGVIQFLETAEYFKKNNSTFNFILIGKQEQGKDSISFSKIEKYIKNNVITYIPKSYDIANHLKNSKFFVLPSIYREGMPRTMIEALSVGRPVLVTNIPGPKDVIINKKHGMLINETNSKEIIKSLEYLINLSEKDYSNMSFNCRKLAKDMFDVKIIIKEYINQILKQI